RLTSQVGPPRPRRPARLLPALLVLGAALWALGHAAAGTPSRATPAAQAVGGGDAAATRGAPLAGRTITLDPGHNGGNFSHPRQIARLVPDGNGRKECDTTGTAAPDGYRETDFNWSVA